jgi:hypothetical protein
MKFILLLMLFTNSAVTIHSVEFETQNACAAAGQAAKALAGRINSNYRLDYLCTPAQ